jgi:hypothetical protein
MLPFTPQRGETHQISEALSPNVQTLTFSRSEAVHEYAEKTAF